MLLRCIAEAVMAQGLQCLLGIVPFGERLYAIGQDARRRYRERCQEKETADKVAAAAGAALQDVRDEARQVFAEIRASAAPEVATQLTDPRVERNLISYMEQVPATVRQTLRRPSDPSGETVPDGFSLGTPEAFLRFLPTGLPRFHVGDRPLQADWELEEMLGKGGFGEVWRARHLTRSTASRVALKFCLDPVAADSLRNEADLHDILDRVQQQAGSRGVVRLLETFLRADPPCLMYEYVEGGDLTALILDLTRQSRLTPKAAMSVVHRLAVIMGSAHRLDPPLVHRDLKPSNILVRRGQDGKYTLLVADLGIGGLAARRALEEQAAHRVPTQQTLPAAVRGAFTPLYASPQQAGGEPHDPRDDVHALGVIWYQLVTGNLDLTSIPPDWSRIARHRGLDPNAVELLGDCIASVAESRPADAQVLADRLAAIMTGSPDSERQRQAEVERQRAADEQRRREEAEREKRDERERQRKAEEQFRREEQERQEAERKRKEPPVERTACPDLPGDKGSYILWVGPPLVETPRFVHFSWGGRNPMAFKIRDYLAGLMQHHPGGSKQPDKRGFKSASISECEFDRDEVWQRATLWIPTTADDLYHDVQDFPWWEEKLDEMTRNRDSYAHLSIKPRRR